jgi:HPt (histidine-containing phosphotransfer) domain-containing protein
MKKTQEPENACPINFQTLFERIGDNGSFLNQLLDLYFLDFENKHQSLSIAIQKRDFKSIAEVSHSLKGSSANLSLPFLQETSSQLEKAALEKNMELIKSVLIRLQKEFIRLKDFLSKEKNHESFRL